MDGPPSSVVFVYEEVQAAVGGSCVIFTKTAES